MTVMYIVILFTILSALSFFGVQRYEKNYKNERGFEKKA